MFIHAKLAPFVLVASLASNSVLISCSALALASDHRIVLHRGKVALTVTIHPGEAKTVEARIGRRLVWEGLPPEWDPWKLAVFDIDNKHCFIVGLYRHTRHLPWKHHTLYVYGFDGQHVFPRWRGSFMGRDFVDFAVVGPSRAERVITLDRLLDGKLGIACQQWSGFGFHKEWERGDWTEAKLLASKNAIEVMGDSKLLRYSLAGEREVR